MDNQAFDLPKWTRHAAGEYSATVAGHRVTILNSPYFFPRLWRVECDGVQIIATRTLRDARGWVEGKFCYRRWNVSYSGHHWYMGLCTTRPGTYTHFEALAECERRQAAGMVA
jgi:hypothetical protein